MKELLIGLIVVAWFGVVTFARADTYLGVDMQQGVATNGNWIGEYPNSVGIFLHHDLSERWSLRAGWEHKSNPDRGCNFYCWWVVDDRPETWTEEVYIRIEARIITWSK